MSSVETANPQTAPPRDVPNPRALRSSPSDELALFHYTLARACRAGVPLAAPLRALADELRRPALATAARDLGTDLDAGTPFAEAYARHATVFPPLYRDLVEAGMASGDLAGVLEDLGTDAQLRASTKARMRRAVARPFASLIAVLIIGGLAWAMAATSVQDAAVFISGDAPSAGPYGRPGVSHYAYHIAIWAGPILIGVLVLSLIAWTLWGHPIDGGSARGTKKHPLGLRVPVLGTLRTLAAKATFANTLALLLRRRLPLDRALTLTAAATDDPTLRAEVETMARRAQEGGNVRQSLGAGALLPDSMLWFVEGAERQPEHGLTDIAQVYSERFDHAVERTTLLLTPLAELVVGLVVLLFAVRLLAPALGILNVLGM